MRWLLVRVLPRILARAGLPTVKAVWDETEALLLASYLRPLRRSQRRQRIWGRQHGRHLA